MSGTAINNTRVRKSETVLDLRVRNFSAEPASARFEWFFLAQNVQGKGTFAYGRGEEIISVLGSAEVKKTLESGELVQSTNKTSTIEAMTPSPQYPNARAKITNTQTKQGSRPVGWIVRMSIGYDVVAVRASSSEYEKIGRDPFLQGISLTPVAPANPRFGPGGVPR